MKFTLGLHYFNLTLPVKVKSLYSCCIFQSTKYDIGWNTSSLNLPVLHLQIGGLSPAFQFSGKRESYHLLGGVQHF